MALIYVPTQVLQAFLLPHKGFINRFLEFYKNLYYNNIKGFKGALYVRTH